MRVNYELVESLIDLFNMNRSYLTFTTINKSFRFGPGKDLQPTLILSDDGDFKIEIQNHATVENELYRHEKLGIYIFVKKYIESVNFKWELIEYMSSIEYENVLQS